MHRVGAADPAAVGPFGLPGADALDEDGAAGLLDLGGPFHQFSIKLQVGHDPGIFAVEVFRGLEFPGAGGHHRDAVRNRLADAVDFDLTGKVAHGAGDRLEDRIFEHGDPGMIFHPGNQVGKPGPDVVAFPGLIQAPGIAAQLGRPFPPGWWHSPVPPAPGRR